MILVFMLLTLIPVGLHATEMNDVYVDEGSQTLILKGQFGLNPGKVTVDGIRLPLIEWSDSEIICHIDSDGRGSCGPIQVEEADGTFSDTELLTWISIHFIHNFITGGTSYLERVEEEEWQAVFRIDFNFLKSAFASRLSTASFSYSGGGDGDPQNYGGKLYSIAGNGTLNWLQPTSTSQNGFQVYIEGYDTDALTISFSNIDVPNALQVVIYSQPNYQTDTLYSDFTFYPNFGSNSALTVTLDSAYQPIGGKVHIPSQFPQVTEYYSWSKDTVKFSPQPGSLEVNPLFETEKSMPQPSAYPNPSSGRVRIAYQLPPGVSSGEVILTREDGSEVKRYRVTNAFSNLRIEESDLPSGAYFYKLVTEKGESPSQAISVIK